MLSLLSKSARISSWIASVIFAMASTAIAEDTMGYSQVASIFQKYCSGCHNAEDAEADFSVASYEAMLEWKSTEADSPHDSLIVAGKPAESRLVRLMRHTGKPAMPPEDEPQPTEEDLKRVEQWIAQGALATGSAMSPDGQSVMIPAAAPEDQYVTSACYIDAGELAIGRLGQVQSVEIETGKVNWTADGLPGKANQLRTSADNSWIVVSSGVVGKVGEVVLIRRETGEIAKRFQGHTDAVYCASLTADNRWLASGSYDRSVIVWDVESVEQRHVLKGHNGAIYDLDFDPSGALLATASGDQTVKLWNVASGERLDTLGQPEKEMLSVRFSEDGGFLFAGGADRQIRQWKIVSSTEPSISPMLVARYAHEKDVLYLQRVGSNAVASISSDGTAKLWTADELLPLGELATLKDTPVSICVRPESPIVFVDLSGATHLVPIRAVSDLLNKRATVAAQVSREAMEIFIPSPDQQKVAQPQTESEPNDRFDQAEVVSLPLEVSGAIDGKEEGADDVDLYRFVAQAGEPWIIEINAARSGSKLDSIVDVLDADGVPVLQTRLQAVRESYFTFRGKDASTSDDFRLHKWEDMELDEFLYSSGEVTRLWLYPRGPDSGFKVYPGSGERATFFGSTPVSHALGETAYIVRPLPRDAVPLPNGLPLFPIYFENDDDPQRKWGADSHLTFIAPVTGEYLVRVRDARGFSGKELTYQLKIRQPQPEFSLQFGPLKLEMPTGSGREWSVTAERFDGLEEAIEIELVGLPKGFVATNPVVIEAGQRAALGTVFATANAEATEAKIQLVARVRERGIERKLQQVIELGVSELKEVQLRLLSSDESSQDLEEIVIHPGQTVSAKVIVDRNGFEGRIPFGNEDSGRNLPHGAFVDNIGLNGLLIPEGQSAREFFITAAAKVPPGVYQFHLRSQTAGNPTSKPLRLRVLSQE